MKYILIALLFSCSFNGILFAQDSVFRCGNHYTNTPEKELEPSTCRLVTKPKSEKKTDIEISRKREACLNEATKAPTTQGLNYAIAACYEKFHND